MDFAPRRPIPKPKKENCEIDIRNTPSGKKIRFRGKCSKEEIEVARSSNNED